jgi:hypothetical protein
MVLCEEIELHVRQFAVPFCGAPHLGEPPGILDRFQQSTDRSGIGPKFRGDRHRTDPLLGGKPYPVSVLLSEYGGKVAG